MLFISLQKGVLLYKTIDLNHVAALIWQEDRSRIWRAPPEGKIEQNFQKKCGRRPPKLRSVADDHGGSIRVIQRIDNRTAI